MRPPVWVSSPVSKHSMSSPEGSGGPLAARGSVPREARSPLAGRFLRLVHHGARRTPPAAPPADRHAEHAAASVARSDREPTGDTGDRGSGAGGDGRGLPLAALVRADRGPLCLVGGGRACLALAHAEPPRGRVRLRGRNTPGRRSKPARSGGGGAEGVSPRRCRAPRPGPPA